ncbi:MAG TPA: hypothetical protein O0Y13_05245 [Methanocorpusculum sp.]|nr:hypothetical protein [Methanocorpusculum sp.]HJK62637.1 hypothetical protein [Methanocorpusculum sp.]HJK63446.1 hypothetical protein [Methanocorpusculum sp.]HJK68455.1 hypothetical protein [Methanocorpusculum sp.]
MVKRTYRKPSPRTDSKREGAAISRAKSEIRKAKAENKKAATALDRVDRELRTAGRYNKSERRGMKRR